MKTRAVLMSMRPPFLILTPACLFLGFCTALVERETIDYHDLIIVFLGAVSAHISVNTFNEYFDSRSGLDARTSRTPFSGGSGALLECPEATDLVLYVAISFLSLTILVGLYFVYLHGMLILPIGLIGILIVLTYTLWINRHPLICLVAPGVGFGPLMVTGTHVVLAGEYSHTATYASLVPFFLVNNLLLLNQYPDIQADRIAGRNHFPIAYGVTNSTIIYGLFVAACSLVIAGGIFFEYLPKLSYISLIPLCVAMAIIPGVHRHAYDAPRLVPYLGINVVVTVLTPLLLGLAILLR